MAILTVRIPDELKDTMDSMDEINWSAVTRNLLQEKVNEFFIKDRISKAEKQIKNKKYVSHSAVVKKYLE